MDLLRIVGLGTIKTSFSEVFGVTSLTDLRPSRPLFFLMIYTPPCKRQYARLISVTWSLDVKGRKKGCLPYKNFITANWAFLARNERTDEPHGAPRMDLAQPPGRTIMVTVQNVAIYSLLR